MNFDIAILTDKRFLNPEKITPYIQNVLTEDALLGDALSNLGLSVTRINWDDEQFDWTSTQFVLFRTTWDYFDRYDEFSVWLENVNTKTTLINPKSLIYWNIDKHYLLDLEAQGIRIPPTKFVSKNSSLSLNDLISNTGWQDFILKPVVSGAARHTYKIARSETHQFEKLFTSLIATESMMIQEYQHQITTKGEVAFMIFGGQFSHAVLKKAKSGDFRVQDDFGGTVEEYQASDDEIQFAEKCVQNIQPLPIYARVDVIWDNQNLPCVGEIELIEPELWFRMDKNSASKCAQQIAQFIAHEKGT